MRLRLDEGELERVKVGMIFTPMVEISRFATITGYDACEDLNEEGMVVECVKERNEGFSRASDAEGTPHVEGVVISKSSEEVGFASGECVSGQADLALESTTWVPLEHGIIPWSTRPREVLNLVVHA